MCISCEESWRKLNISPSATAYGAPVKCILLTPCSRVLLEKLTGLQLVKKFPSFYGTRKFITALTSLRHRSLSWASPIQSIYTHPTSWRSSLILSTLLRLGLPSGLFPSGFPTKTLYTPISPIRATCPAHLILLDFITHTILGKEYKSFSSSLCNLLHSPVTSSLLGPNILLNTCKMHLTHEIIWRKIIKRNGKFVLKPTFYLKWEKIRIPAVNEKKRVTEIAKQSL